MVRALEAPAPLALWYEAPRSLTLGPGAITPMGPGQILLEALYSGISRGTERLIFEGRVPDSEHTRMRCPNQEGAFPFPAKYGYCFVGEIVAAAADLDPKLVGRRAFALFPHQSHAVLAADGVQILPEALPPRRAVLAANCETALNILWDSGVSLGDSVLVVGAGVVGLLVARLLAKTPGVRVTLTDRDPQKAPIAAVMGAYFCPPEAVTSDHDIAINTSASEAGLHVALAAVALEGRVVEASWFGDRSVALPLGGAFHSQRLQLISSQVGRIPAQRAARWDYRRRLATAIALLDDPALDALLTHEIAFKEAPQQLPALFDPATPALAIVLRYPAAEEAA